MQPSKIHVFWGVWSTDTSIAAGVTQVQLHEKSKKHSNSLKSKSSKSTFFSTASSLFISAGLQRKILSTGDQVEKSEIIWYLDIVDSNCLFSVANRDSSKYKDMFPDSQIAKS